MQLLWDLGLADECVEAVRERESVLGCNGLRHERLRHQDGTGERRTSEELGPGDEDYCALAELLVEPVDLEPALARVDHVEAAHGFGLGLQLRFEGLADAGLGAVDGVDYWYATIVLASLQRLGHVAV